MDHPAGAIGVVMLVPSPRHTPADLEMWAALAAADALRAKLPVHARRVQRSLDAIRRFVADHPDTWVGVSIGKDSLVAADLALSLHPGIRLRKMVLTRAPDQPGTRETRDLFLAAHPGVDYDEFETDAADGLAAMSRWMGDAPRITGVRGDESVNRRLSARVHGVATDRSCRPLLHWSADDVFAYSCAGGLPVHPVYAMTLGGRLARRHLRVHALGGPEGVELGRREWERCYFPELLVTERLLRS
ncbi:MAG: hypothetical protein ACRDSN_00420 [Pseudonocardiaceae bacterium]